jgi:hypothetical protein
MFLEHTSSFKEKILDLIKTNPLVEITTNKQGNPLLSYQNKKGLSRMECLLNMSSVYILQQLAGWEFAWKSISQNSKFNYGVINVPTKKLSISDCFSSIPIENDSTIKIGHHSFDQNNFDDIIYPIDINLDNYNACIIEVDMKSKIAFLDKDGKYWKDTKMISVPEYLNFISYTLGSVEARKQYFFSHIEEHQLTNFILQEFKL